MASTFIQTYARNAATFTVQHVITATDVTNGAITFAFQTTGTRPLVAIAAHMLSTGSVENAVVSGTLPQPTIGMTITYPGNGQVNVAKGAVTWVAGDILVVIASTYNSI